MKRFVNYVIDIFIGYLKRFWFLYQRDKLEQELEIEKKEMEDAEKLATEAVNDFERYYELLKLQEKELSKDGSKSEDGKKSSSDS